MNEQVQQMIFSFNEKVGVHWTNEHKIKFAALVAAHEREACAKACEGRGMVKGGEVFAARIRARGQSK